MGLLKSWRARRAEERLHKRRERQATLSRVLDSHHDELQNTVKPYIEITAEPARGMRPTQSRFGGLPYLPKHFDQPTDSEGRHLSLLAQINLGEVPKLDPFPTEGLLQFYVRETGSWGLNYQEPCLQDGFRVAYFAPELLLETPPTDFLTPGSQRLPFGKHGLPWQLHFELKKMVVNADDYNFDRLFRDCDEELAEAVAELHQVGGHRMGGYANFMQEDPRHLEQHADKTVLLLQIDTDNENRIIWGDAGVGNFFIGERALERCDFQDVLYNWDCC